MNPNAANTDTCITESDIRNLRLWLEEQAPDKMSLRALTIRAYLRGLSDGVARVSYEQVREQVNRMAS